MYKSDVLWPGAGAGWPRGAAWWVLLLGLLAACLGFLFKDALWLLVDNYRRPEYSHGYIIPAVTAYIIWRRWPAVRRDWSAGSMAGLAILAGAVLLLLVSKLAQAGTLQALALVLSLTGVALAGLGWRAMRHLWVPLAFLLFAVPLPSTVHVLLSLRLQLLSSEIGAWLLQLAGVTVFLDGNVIDLGVYKLQVAEACSGLSYLFPLSAFGFLCAWLYNGPAWTRILIFLSAVPITVVMNSVRIALTGLFIEHGSIALAEGFLHLFEGWVIFLVGLLMLFAVMWLLSRLRDGPARGATLLDFGRLAGHEVRPEESPERLGQRPPAPLIACCGLLLATALTVDSMIERRPVVPDRPGLASFPMQVGDWRGAHAPVEDESIAALRDDGLGDHLLADFQRPAGAAPVNLWVAYYPTSESALLATHSPQACLPGGGWEFASLTQQPAPAGAVGFTLNRALITKGEEQALMYYWYEGRGRHFAREFWLKIYFLVDALATGRSDSALVRMVTPVLPHESVDDAEARLSSFLEEMSPHLQPHLGT